MSLIPNIQKSYFYIVENISASDKTNANSVVATGSLGVDNYDILEYIGAYTFDGTETYFQQLTSKEMDISVLSGAFWDLIGELNNPATHMSAHDKYRPFAANDQYFCHLLLDDLEVHLSYVIAGGTTGAQRHTMYNNTLQPLCIDLAVGDVASAAYFLSTVTGADLASLTGLGTAAQWDQLLTHVNMMVGPFLEKFPR